jgi:hypothetical protein
MENTQHKASLAMFEQALGIGAEMSDADIDQANEKLVEEANQKRNELDDMIYRTFVDGPGAEMLEWLRANTIETPVTSALGMLSAVGVNMSTDNWLFFRAGQNSIYHEIDAAIRRVKARG